jgi:hypothetical protein
MKKFVLAILLIFSVICALTNCSVPLGSIEDSKNKYVIESMWLIPRRQLYQIDDKFMRDEDFKLYIVDRRDGVVEILPPFTVDNGVTVEIAANINLSNEFHEMIETTHHPLHQIGRHIITVTFAEKSEYYSIEVFNSQNGNSLGGDDGIGIIWLE